ncbi:uncharacterized protein LOC112502466 [Cynara cardunculus var. scolymus]|uniref:uncharacterized protein LOC112502466 n=1 Tax=Cynara cardunculus var. scolymus TaxID=59895 RepID=UPI000D625193|nr:uncharacterized protein LOC112502466 [Cynara cardunculus var. scolymus]
MEEFIQSCFLFTKIRSHGSDLALIVGIGGLGFFFSNYNQGDPALDAKMLQIWETRGAKNYNDGMNSARRKAGKKARSQLMPYVENDPNRDMNMLKGFHPKWLDPRIWYEMIDRWNTPHWKGVVSKIVHDNQMTIVEGDIAKHTGGSITFALHGSRLTKAKNWCATGRCGTLWPYV